MGSSRLVFLIITVISASESPAKAEAECVDMDVEKIYISENEAYYFVPYPLLDQLVNYSDSEQFMWYKKMPNITHISSDEKKRIHHHGRALLFLNSSTEDSGSYTARHTFENYTRCYSYHLNITVFKASDQMKKSHLFGSIKNSDQNKNIPCPIADMCDIVKGEYTWYKNFSLLQGSYEPNLRVPNASKKDEGIYTCICTWKHNHKLYKSSGSRELIHLVRMVHAPLQIDVSQKAKGSEMKLTCFVYCGTNVQKYCTANWHVNGIPFTSRDGYNQTIKIDTKEPSKMTSATAILTIQRVSAKDFQDKFMCLGEGFYETVNATLPLIQNETIIPLVRAVCVVVLFVFMAMIVNYFAIDLALLFRMYFPLSSHEKGKEETFISKQDHQQE